MNGLAKYDAACRALAACTKVDEVKGIHDKAIAVKAYAKQAGDGELAANAARIIWLAKDRMGGLLNWMLEKGERRARNDGPVLSSKLELNDLGISKKLASQATQVASIAAKLKDEAIASAQPDKEMRALLSKYRRESRHKGIAAKAKATVGSLGQYALVYADPPWKFETYSEKGLVKAPDQHYATLTDSEICELAPNGIPITELTTKSAALLLWCTSSNIERALAVMSAWGFDYKSQAVWVKLKLDGQPWPGTGLVFRNMHEVLLYGTKGSMPGPQWQPPSVFMLPRGKHSEKPAEIRQSIERMYPDFDAETRIELFSRHGLVEGWTHWGLEA